MVVENQINKSRRNGKALLAIAVGVDQSTLSRWLKNGVPTAHAALYLALACGCGPDEALQLAKEECPSEVAKETA